MTENSVEKNVEKNLNEIYMDDVAMQYHRLISELISDPDSMVDWIKTKDLVYMLSTVNKDVGRLQKSITTIGDYNGILLALGDIGLTLACMKKRIEIEQHQKIDMDIDLLAQHMKAYIHDTENDEGILTYNVGRMCETMRKEIDTIEANPKEPIYIMDLLVTTFAGWRKHFCESKRDNMDEMVQAIERGLSSEE